jgi:phosphoenolpyruvate-protein kinase (PTS system EI component)
VAVIGLVPEGCVYSSSSIGLGILIEAPSSVWGVYVVAASIDFASH